MAGAHPPSYPFYPRDWVVDTRRMSRDQRCRYHDALCESWLSHSYGVGTEDQWRQWMDYTPEEWASERAVFVERFKVKGEVWTQKRMKETRDSQRRRHQKARNGGLVTQRNRKEKASTATSIATTLAFASAVASASAVEEESSTSSDSSGELKRGSRSKGVRGKKPVARTPIEERHILAAVERFNLPEPIVRTIAERITLEADERGYRVLPSALLNWCAREQSNPTPRGRHNGLSAAEIFALADRMEAKERADEAV